MSNDNINLTDVVAAAGDAPIALNLSNIKDQPCAVGWHAVEIERAEYGTSSKKGLPKIFVLSRITDEADPDFNRTIIWNLMLSGEGLVFTKRCFVALGYPEVLEYPTADALADSLIGLQVEVRVKHRVYQGNNQAQVNNWRPLTPEVY